jgi:hypothetical protein
MSSEPGILISWFVGIENGGLNKVKDCTKVDFFSFFFFLLLFFFFFFFYLFTTMRLMLLWNSVVGVELCDTGRSTGRRGNRWTRQGREEKRRRRRKKKLLRGCVK